jgi:hypothetical protein
MPFSVWKCAFCAVIRTRSYRTAEAVAKRMGRPSGTGGINLNPSTCPFLYIELNGKVYKRDTGEGMDDDEEIEEYCHDCGIKNRSGITHHVECDCESCPRCKGQLISCSCTANGARYFKGPADAGKYHKDLLMQKFLDVKGLLRFPGVGRTDDF